MRLTTARYYTPDGRSIQALGISPDIVVAQPRPDPEAPEEDEEPELDARPLRTEADLRGSLENEDVSEEEREQIEAEREKAEAAAALREEDYQLAYAIDILKGVSGADGSELKGRPGGMHAPRTPRVRGPFVERAVQFGGRR